MTLKAALSKLLSDTAFAATFFHRYWLILNAPFQDAEWLATSLDDLGIANVGVALHEERDQDDLNLFRSPTGKPLPDRQERSLKYISM